MLVTAVSTIAFKQAIGMLRRGGTCVLNGLPPGEFPVSIFELVLNGHTVRGSIVGTRLDLEESLAFTAEGKVKATIETLPWARSTMFSTGSRAERSATAWFLESANRLARNHLPPEAGLRGIKN